MLATAVRRARLAAAVCAGALVVAGPAEAAVEHAEPRPGARAHVAFRVPHQPANMADYLSMVIDNVHGYWAGLYAEAGRKAPFVRFNWVAPGDSAANRCARRTGRGTAYYCPRDDTIHFSQLLAVKLWERFGDFGLAAAIAHEYAHNVQQELGVYRLRRRTARPFELMADCMAGMWANSAYYSGLLEGTDVEEAAAAFYALGDYARNDPGHHGTPKQRKRAFMRGYNAGGDAGCGVYLRKRR